MDISEISLNNALISASLLKFVSYFSTIHTFIHTYMQRNNNDLQEEVGLWWSMAYCERQRGGRSLVGSGWRSAVRPRPDET